VYYSIFGAILDIRYVVRVKFLKQNKRLNYSKLNKDLILFDGSQNFFFNIGSAPNNAKQCPLFQLRKGWEYQ
jgi:hypothetical protein